MLADIRNYVDELRQIKEELRIDKFDSDELEELLSNWGTDDFIVDLDGREFRFIDEDAIDRIYYDEIEMMMEDYYDLDSLPDLIRGNIDMDGIVRDCKMDGYEHTFSSYDGSEYNVGQYYIFRTS